MGRSLSCRLLETLEAGVVGAAGRLGAVVPLAALPAEEGGGVNLVKP